jgi:hypothetical protein
VMFMPRGLWGVVEAWLPGARTSARRQQPAPSAAADAPLDSKVSQQCARSSPSAT